MVTEDRAESSHLKPQAGDTTLAMAGSSLKHKAWLWPPPPRLVPPHPSQIVVLTGGQVFKPVVDSLFQTLIATNPGEVLRRGDWEGWGLALSCNYSWKCKLQNYKIGKLGGGVCLQCKKGKEKKNPQGWKDCSAVVLIRVCIAVIKNMARSNLKRKGFISA